VDEKHPTEGITDLEIAVKGAAESSSIDKSTKTTKTIL
jgi:hypothetical protein